MMRPNIPLDMMNSKDSNSQKRNLSLWSAAGVVVCGMVGAGIFTTTGLHAAELGSRWAVMLVWAVGGLLALCGTLTYIELAALWPEAGGSYIFVRNIYGPMSGFVVGLSVAIVGIMGSMAVVGLTLGSLFPKNGSVDSTRHRGYCGGPCRNAGSLLWIKGE